MALSRQGGGLGTRSRKRFTDKGDLLMSGSNTARAGLLLLASLCLPRSAAQAAAPPCAALAGAGAGGGILNATDGSQERLRCRASYDVGGSGTELRLTM